MIPRHIVDAILSATRIEEVIGDFVTLKRSGSALKALSPFSKERTPSFYVSPAKQIFKDFSSGKGGNAVTFLMDHEQISYPEALRYLAKKYHIDIPEEKDITPEEHRAATEKESLLILLNWAAEYYRNQLETPDGIAIGKTYFNERGFRAPAMKTFDLGYAPEGWDNLTKAALAAGFREDLLVLAGLSKVSEAGKRFDMFRGRVIFPIHNMMGRVVAFAGRQLSKDDKGPKYLNSPETPVYHKSDVLYGLAQAKNSIRNLNKCLLTEGYTDVITLHQAGIENVVASSGTALTESQIRLIKRFTPDITVLYDGDPAGLRASQRGIDLILKEGMNVRLVIFPDGEDPDSYCKRVGGPAFEQYIKEHEQDFILFKSRLLLEDAGNDPIKKIAALQNMMASIALIPEPLNRNVFVQQCAQLMGVEEGLVMAEVNKLRKQEILKEHNQQQKEANQQTSIDPAHFEEAVANQATLRKRPDTEKQELALIKIAVRQPNAPYDEHRNVSEFLADELSPGLEFSHPVCVKIINEIKFQLEQGLVPDSQYFSQHPDQEIAALTADAMMEKYALSPNWEAKFEIFTPNEQENYRQDLNSCMLHYKLRKIEVLMDRLSEDLEQALSEDNQILLMMKYQHLMQMRSRLSDAIGATIISWGNGNWFYAG